MRILLIGFSVTADKAGYSEKLKKYVDGITVIGIGGINPLPLPGIFDSITDRHGHFDFVLLEISTSIYSSNAQAEESKSLLQDLVHRIQSTGARVGFVSLYRDDFSYDTQILDPLIRSMCEQYAFPLLDIGPALLGSHGRDFCRTLLRDVVHTNEKGAEFQADYVAAFIKGLDASPKQLLVPLPKLRHYQLPLGDEPFSRSGFDCTYLTIRSESSRTVDVPKTASVYGIGYLTDPTAGLVKVTADRSHTLSFLYAHSYYQHYCFRRVGLRGAITFEQLPDVPDVRLLKGAVSEEPRTAKLAAIHLVVAR